MYDIFNLGESQTIQLKDLISAIENAVGKKAKINQPRGTARRYAAVHTQTFEGEKIAWLQSQNKIE